jgi:histone acetyltransferase (RNA polymerase elongator complex component)
MMTGLPGSDADSDYRTAERIAALRPDGARIYPAVIVRDTELYERWKRGEYREHTVEDATETCARILPLFEEAGISVIRIGLNPTEELSGGAAVAGAYHPALGELVKSRILRKRAEELLRAVPAGSRVTLGIDRPLISQLIGQHRANLSWLKTRYGLSALKILPLDTKNREIRVIAVEK